MSVSLPEIAPLPELGGLSAGVCGKCHAQIYAEWSTSMMAKAATDPFFLAERAEGGNLFLYARWTLGTALLAGAGAGIAGSILDLLYSYPGAKPEFAIVYTITSTISGIVVAGLGSWLLVKALARTGALSRFAAGREATWRV